jgi:dephospho-CoA kinase
VITIGLTGSIGMGKTATAAMFSRRGVPVYDADAEVHRAYAPGGAAVEPVLAVFPEARSPDGGVDRARLRATVLGDPERMAALERITHPIIASVQRAFLDNASRSGADMVVLDIPLLFERGGVERVDYVVVVSAPRDVQRSRVLARGMSEPDFEAILARQTPDAVKREKADFVIDTSQGFSHAEAQVDRIIDVIRTGRATPRRQG